MGETSKNSNLHLAKADKNDEFYTQLANISDELKHYKSHFKGKVVYCNCDDPYESNFFRYFALNFNELGLKKLICTCYADSLVADTQLSLAQKSRAYKVELSEVIDINGDGATDLRDINAMLCMNKYRPIMLDGDGDFRSEECIEMLKEADIVVTNPPFSLFREYIAQLIEYDKKFLIIGNQNNVTYKEIFPLIKDNKVWLGYHCGDMAFTVPDSYEAKEVRFWVDDNGQKWRSLGNICWYTNLEHDKRNENLILYKTYNEEEYPKYDGYDVINVNKVADIPADYMGVMGVPITFLSKYNPNQFEILGMANSARWISYNCLTIIDGVKKYNRIILRRKI